MEYGWQISDLEEKINSSSNSRRSLLEKDVYKEMINDYTQKRDSKGVITKAQFRRAINQFDISNYQEEISLILYIGQLLSPLEVELPIPTLSRYPEEDVVNLAKIYMRRKEPADFPYFRRISNCQEKIQFCYLSSITSFLGKTYFLDKNNYYILVNSINGIQDTVTLLHESGHVENYLKYGINLSKYYAELASMTREHYSFDMLQSYDQKAEVEKQRNLSLNHYIARIIRLYSALYIFLLLKRNREYLKNVLVEFDRFSSCFDVKYLYELLSGSLEKEIGYALSFIASLDIYSNCTPKEANLFITGYQIGTRKVSKKAIDRVVQYLFGVLGPYQKVKNI